MQSLLLLGLEWSAQGWPTLLARSHDGELVGFYLCGPIQGPFLQRTEGLHLMGLGSYVTPEFRHAGLRHALFGAACGIGRELGAVRIIGTVSAKNQKGLDWLCEHEGGRILSLVLEKEL